jgi:hypothetical protein
MSRKNPTKALPATLIPGINRIKPAHDREALKHIKSPDVSKMKFQLHDPKMRSTVYFATLERKNRYIERMAAQHNNHESLKKGGRTSK